MIVIRVPVQDIQVLPDSIQIPVSIAAPVGGLNIIVQRSTAGIATESQVMALATDLEAQIYREALAEVVKYGGAPEPILAVGVSIKGLFSA